MRLRFNPMKGLFDIILSKLNELTDVTITAPSENHALEYDGSEWVNRVPIVSQATNEPMGVEDPDNWTIEYDPATQTVTATPAGTEYIWVKGVRYEFSAPIVVAHAAVSDTYFLQLDDTGTAVFDTSFDFENKANIAIVVYDSAQTPEGFGQREVHDTVMDWQTHRENHRNIGTSLVSGGGLTSGTFTVYDVSDGTNPTLASITPAIPETVVSDEGLRTTLLALADGGPYTRLYHQWTTGKWIWETGADAPFFHTANVPEYNPESGGDLLVSITNDSYVCWYCLAVPVSDDAGSQLFRYFWVPGQEQYTSALPNARARQAALNLALSEDPRSLSLTDLPFSEYVIHAKLVMEYRTTWTNNDYRLRVVGYQKIVGSRANLTSTGVIATPTVLDSNVSITTASDIGGLRPSVETTQDLVNERYAEFGYVGDWATSKAYRVGNVVTNNLKLYQCTTLHTSGVFYTDLAAGNWILIGNSGHVGRVQTTDATQTTLMSIATSSDTCGLLSVDVSAFEAATGDCKTVHQKWRLKNDSGVLTVEKFVDSGSEDSGTSGWAVIVDVSGATARVRVTGEAAHVIVWNGTARTTYV